jgi:fosfomycin resistance protein FosX
MMPQNTKLISGISHITFICQDLVKITHFLKELFDVQEVYSSGDKTFSISKEKFFNIAGIWIAIMEGTAIERSYHRVDFQVAELIFLGLKPKLES